MKRLKQKGAFAALVFGIALVFVLAGCDIISFGYKITFRVDGETYAIVDASGNETVKIPEDPEKEGYTFDGWFWDENVWEKPFTADSLLKTPISSNMSVYAKFSPLHDHEFSAEWSYDADNHWKDCSCGEKDGFAPHSWTVWSVEKAATEEEEGIDVRSCTVCGQEEHRTVDKLSHENTKQNYDLSNVRFADSAVTYDGQEHSIYISFTQGGLPAGVSVRYENNGQTDAGEYLVTAIFTGNAETHNPIPAMTATLTIRKAKINMENVIFESQEVTYDGEFHSLTVQNLPKEVNGEDITYYYNGQQKTGVSEPGEYTVIAVFREIYNYESIANLRATLKIVRVTYEEKYERYSVLGKTIDLIHADSITDTVSGGKRVFNDNLMGVNINRQDFGRQESLSTSSSDISEVMKDFSNSINERIAFGSRTNQNGGFLTNLLPSLDFAGSGSYQKEKKSKTSTYSYMYSYIMDGYRVDIEGYRDPSKFKEMLSDDLIADAEKVRHGSLSPETFVQMWGTHVIMSAIYGEKADVTYTAMAHDGSNCEQRAASLKAELEERFLKMDFNTSVSAGASNLKTESTSNLIQKLQINVTSKNLLAATSMDQFMNAMGTWQQGDHENSMVFTDVPDESLYCIWYLLGDEYSDVIKILDDYMESRCSELYNSKLNAIYSLILTDDFEYDEKTLTLNLGQYQESGNLTQFQATYFNRGTGILTVYPEIDSNPIEKIVINGSYQLKNPNGQTITKKIDFFALEFDGNWKDDLEIVLNNVGFNADDNLSAFDFSAVNNSFNVTFTVNGTNEICAGSGTSAGSAIKGNHLNLTFRSSDPNASLTLRGGNGENGTNGKKNEGLPDNVGQTENGNMGGTGYIGNPGYDGGAAVKCSSMVVSSGNIILIGGDGGDGGQGGQGGMGGFGGDGTRYGLWDWHGPGQGGQGGFGGKGGTGGKAGMPFEISDGGKVNMKGGKARFECGEPGDGGKGGKGGTGGKGGSTEWPNAPSGNGGTGGTGGEGGDWQSLPDVSELSKYVTGATQNVEYIVDKQGHAGDGGDGGDGGVCGIVIKQNGIEGDTGAPGQPGNPGKKL